MQSRISEETPKSRFARLGALAASLFIVTMTAMIAMPTTTAMAASGPGSVLMTVVDSAGKPIPDVAVHYRVSGSGSGRTLGGDGGLHGTTDSKGRIRFSSMDTSKSYCFYFITKDFLPTVVTLDLDRHREIQHTIKLRKSGSKPAVSLFNEAVKAWNLGGHEEARTWLEQALEHDPDFANARGALAELNLLLGNHEASESEALATLEIQPGNLKALSVLYEATLETGNLENQQRALEELTANGSHPNLAATAYNKGVDLRRAQNLVEARRIFEQSLHLDPSLVNSHVALATIAIAEKDYTAAGQAIEDSLALDPSHRGALKAQENLRAQIAQDQEGSSP